MSQKSQNTQKSKPEKQSRPAVERQDSPEQAFAAPELTQGGKFIHPGELPPELARKQVQEAGVVAGNQFIQREMLKNVVQRQTPGEGGDTAPIPALGGTEEKQAFALNILKEAYGGLIKKESKVVGKPNEKTLRDAYDLSMINLGKEYKEEDGTYSKWKMGDSKRHPTMSSELVGFWDQDSGNVLIDTSKKPDQQVATVVHEMLHANAAGDFAATMGKTIDEGMTEKLTQQAFAKAGYSAPGGFYAAEIGLVNRLAGMFGENLMMLAYFNGTAILRSMVSTVLDDEKIFDKLVNAIKANQQSYIDNFFYLYERAAAGAEVDKKIAAINSRLDWWVSDDDITAIENIWQGSTEDERTRLRGAIESRITSLMNEAHRVRLRVLLSS
jgi:hypothetical protein